MGELIKPDRFHKRATPELKAKVVIDAALDRSAKGERRAILEAIKERVEGLLDV